MIAPGKSVNRFAFVGSVLFLILMILLSAVPSNIRAQSSTQGFDEEFNSLTLDSAWQVVEFTGARVYGYSQPANHFSLADNPGYLRYYVDPMTHPDGFINNYQTTYGFHSCCNHDPGLELHRTFSGTDWRFETKTSYFLPESNGRWFPIRIYFGDGNANTFYVGFARDRDFGQNFIQIRLAKKVGSTLADVTVLDEILAPPNPGDTYFYRVERAGSVLTALWSDDGITWNTAFTHDMGTQLDGLSQRVVITGLSWFNPAGSYANYDYVKVSAVNTPPSITVNDVTLKSNTTGGRTLLFSSIGSASDAEDGTPLVACNPSIGSVLPLGSTIVSCTATDSGGLSTTDSGTVTVVTTVTMGPQAMEGDLKVSTGDILQVGYDFTMPGSHPATDVGFVEGEVTFPYTCIGSMGSGSFVVPIADQTYADSGNSSAWYPSGDQHNSMVYQGSIVIPSTLCGNNLVRLNQGGTFSSGITASPSGYKVNVRWHYSAHGSAGGWSGTKSIMPN